MPIDKRHVLSEEVFTWRETKSGMVLISFRGKQVTTLSGKAATAFLAKVRNATDHAAQLAMAKATGNFKHGNERRDSEP